MQNLDNIELQGRKGIVVIEPQDQIAFFYHNTLRSGTVESIGGTRHGYHVIRLKHNEATERHTTKTYSSYRTDRIAGAVQVN